MLPSVWQCPFVTGKLCFANATYRGVQRDEASWMWDKIPNPKRVQGIRPCRGFGGFPQFSLHFPKIGGQGVEALKLGHLIEKGTEHEADPGCCNGPVMLTYFSADTAVVITGEGEAPL
jgi:hypothetical protein